MAEFSARRACQLCCANIMGHMELKLLHALCELSILWFLYAQFCDACCTVKSMHYMYIRIYIDIYFSFGKKSVFKQESVAINVKKKLMNSHFFPG